MMILLLHATKIEGKPRAASSDEGYPGLFLWLITSIVP